jgi:hypothetical protein
MFWRIAANSLWISLASVRKLDITDPLTFLSEMAHVNWHQREKEELPY